LSMNPCPKHGEFGDPCPHCAEDAKLLDVAVYRIVTTVDDLVISRLKGRPVSYENLQAALRDLVREIRR
jgi:hypothetical protein